MDLLERSHYVLLPMEWQLSPGQAACNSKVHGKHLRSWMLCPKLSPREPNSLSSWGVFSAGDFASIEVWKSRHRSAARGASRQWLRPRKAFRSLCCMIYLLWFRYGFRLFDSC